MSKPTVVVTRQLPPAALNPILERCDARYWDSEEPIERGTLLEWVQGADGLYCLLTDTVDDELLNAAGPGLRVVATMSVGYDHVDVAALRKRGIILGNTPGVLTETTAELAVALLLATARRLPEGTHAVESGTWPIWRPMWMTGRDIHGSTVGIVGLGRIGAAFARMLGGFGCRILYTGPNEKPEAAQAVNATFAPMDALLQESDFVAVHCPLNEQTRALFSTEAFGKMKATAVLINTSRGGVVDQDALYQALVQGEIAAAGLDVTDPEPLPADHPLVSLENCVILPHIGSATVATRTKMAVMTTENLLAGVEGRPLPNQVD
ncbi:MAG: D-glycerate dehydrogenase [Caldilineaceae bacterium]|nr:D-glycerate dehydrogenase [Caldilineaceae bacterium]MCY4093201.1 D-glycerate dehydrogenase [Caldilineaceae bacterium]MCY4117472.1 D-glycerate dehydrogenase [Caldilineaceae bacterium]MDE0181644.1 D-glycerate dehydrogenase [Caldilineaceae bacterium]MDE0430869.1 D-glycerate dehydrogenase [Caldilineaceae bacterium]